MEFLRSVRGQVSDFPGGNFDDVDLVARRILGPYAVGKPLAVGRPSGAVFGNLRSVGQVDHLAVARRDQKDVPLLVAVGIRDVGDPSAPGRPRWRLLPLVADRELHRPATLAGDDPQIVAPADIADEGDLLAAR